MYGNAPAPLAPIKIDSNLNINVDFPSATDTMIKQMKEIAESTFTQSIEQFKTKMEEKIKGIAEEWRTLDGPINTRESDDTRPKPAPTQ